MQRCLVWVLVTLSFVLSACNDKEDNPLNPNDKEEVIEPSELIVGRWQVIREQGYYRQGSEQEVWSEDLSEYGLYIEFDKDGKGRIDDPESDSADVFLWYIVDNKLITTPDDATEEAAVADILTLDATTLIIEERVEEPQSDYESWSRLIMHRK